MRKKYRILEIEGFNEDNVLIINKKTRYNVANLEEEEKALYFKYRKSGVLLSNINLKYELVNSLRVSPIEVYNYMRDNEKDIKSASIHFNLSKSTIIRYLEIATNYE